MHTDGILFDSDFLLNQLRCSASIRLRFSCTRLSLFIQSLLSLHIIVILIFRAHTSLAVIRTHKHQDNGLTHCRWSRFNSLLLTQWVKLNTHTTHRIHVRSVLSTMIANEMWHIREVNRVDACFLALSTLIAQCTHHWLSLFWCLL